MPAERYPAARATANAVSPSRARSSGVDRDRRRLLDDLLVAALQRALALAEVDEVAVAVAEDLHLDVARPLDELLDVDAVVGEERLALRRRAGEQRSAARRRRAPAASPCRRRRRPP